MKAPYMSSYLSKWSHGISPEEKRAVLDYIVRNGSRTEAEVVRELDIEPKKARAIIAGLRNNGFLFSDTTNKAKSGDAKRWVAVV